MKPSDASLYRVKVFFRDMASLYAKSLLGFAGPVWNVAIMIMKFKYSFLTPKNLHPIKIVDVYLKCQTGIGHQIKILALVAKALNPLLFLFL